MSTETKELDRNAGAESGDGEAAEGLLSRPEVARRCGVSPRTVQSWINGGELEAVNLAAKKNKPRVFVTPQALAAFFRLRAMGPIPRLPRRRRREERDPNSKLFRY